MPVLLRLLLIFFKGKPYFLSAAPAARLPARAERHVISSFGIVKPGIINGDAGLFRQPVRSDTDGQTDEEYRRRHPADDQDQFSDLFFLFHAAAAPFFPDSDAYRSVFCLKPILTVPKKQGHIMRIGAFPERFLPLPADYAILFL